MARYARYLKISHAEDLVLFRSEKTHIGDEGFLGSIISTIGSRLKLKVGRPRKQTQPSSAQSTGNDRKTEITSLPYPSKEIK